MLTTFLSVFVGGLLAGTCYMLGWATGRKYGRDEQWVEDVLAQGRRDAERRDARGRFKAIGGRN